MKKKYCDEFQVGQDVIWPNGVSGAVSAIDQDDDQLMDECGAWFDAYSVDAA